MAVQAGLEAADMAGEPCSFQPSQLLVRYIDRSKKHGVRLTNAPSKGLLQQLYGAPFWCNVTLPPPHY